VSNNKNNNTSQQYGASSVVNVPGHWYHCSHCVLKYLIRALV